MSDAVENLIRCLRANELPEKKLRFLDGDIRQEVLAVNYGREKGVALLRDKGEQINLEMGKLTLCTRRDPYDRNCSREYLCLLYSGDMEEEIFWNIAGDFLETRREVLGNPRMWYNRWAKSLGNKFVDEDPYPLIAELLAVKTCIESGLLTDLDQWCGPDGNTHDLELEGCSLEIKSTVNREKGKVATISSAHQLQQNGEKQLFLLFYRFEKTPDGELSLQSLVESFPEADRLRILQKLKIKEGMLGWNDRKYRLLEEPSCYRVDDSFPKITPENFQDGVFPPGILKIVYDVDLNSHTAVSFPDALRPGANQ